MFLPIHTITIMEMTDSPFDVVYTDQFQVNEDAKKAFNRDGYIILRGVLDKEELANIEKGLAWNKQFKEEVMGQDDDKGRSSKLVLWCHPGNDVTGMLARCEKVAKTSQDLLGGEVYHYHSKLMMKDAKEGGAFVWHQDYGYWYHLCVLRPDLLTVFIAMDDCTLENGCLQVLKGSHDLGRLDHSQIGGQQGCNLERLEFIKKRYEHVNVEMKAGDALFFHCNLLHTSNANYSDKRRWAFLVAYNRADNDPYMPNTCPQYTPLNMVPNDAIRTCKNFTDLSGKEFYNAENDPNVKVSRPNRY